MDDLPTSDAGAPNGAHYAVVVGINHYRSFDPLNGAINDAIRFCQWLGDPLGGGLPKSNIRLVPATTAPNDAGGDPLLPRLSEITDTINEVNEEMREWLLGDPSAYSRSRLYIFLAGHGMSAPRVPAALFAPEARNGSWGSALDVRALGEWYEEYGPFAEVVMFADCCRLRYTKVRVAGFPFDENEMNYRALGSTPRVLYFYATLPDELSYEAPTTEFDEHRGYFSSALDQAIRQAVTPSGYVTHLSLETAVRALMTTLTAPPRHKPAQACDMYAPVNPPFVFGPRRLRPKVCIEVPLPGGVSSGSGHLELLNEDGGIHERSPDGLQGPVWIVEVTPGLYKLRWVDAEGTAMLLPPIDTDCCLVLSRE